MFTQNIEATKTTLMALRARTLLDASKKKSINVEQVIMEACDRVAPVWPLANFIAVNPLQGFEHLSFSQATEVSRAFFHAKGLPNQEFFHEQYRKGRITINDLAESSKNFESTEKKSDLVQVLLEEARLSQSGVSPSESLQDVMLLLSEWADQLKGTKLYPAMQAEVTKWCSAYFDRGEAGWSLPGKEKGLFGAWKSLAVYDENFERAGVPGVREFIEKLPSDSLQAIKKMVKDLGIPDEYLSDYLGRHLAASPGWAGIVANYGRDQKFFLGKNEKTPLLDFLAIRMCYDAVGAIHVFEEEWIRRSAWEGMVKLAQEKLSAPDASSTRRNSLGLIWLEAYEKNYRDRLFKKLEGSARKRLETDQQLERPQAQAVFCIDVRSEAFRRNLENYGNFDTYGFAGFFAIPLAHQPLGDLESAAQCPVLIRPKYLVKETAREDHGQKEIQYLGQKEALETVKEAVHEVKNTSVSPFAMVEAYGGLGFFSLYLKTFVPRLLSRASAGFKKLWLGSVVTELQVKEEKGCQSGPYQVGIPLADQIAIAENSLKIMGLTKNFARLVLLCGHGSDTTNNAYASALDCGACAGRHGAVNAKVAASIFNHPRVRNALAMKEIIIPTDTVFIAGEHNTTTDLLEIFDEDLIPKTHLSDLQRLKSALRQTQESLNIERSKRFDTVCEYGDKARKEVERRSHDWSEARPEWGLAGNACFIVAKRDLTKHLDLEGRSFLHSYDWETDPSGSALEVIMTAPMVVTQWINSQYYFSTVDNEVFGSGTKVIHNPVGKLGVMQGNVSDLKIGLPFQSVHNGRDYVHEPMRLVVVIEAQRDAIECVIQKHDSVKKLVLNQWIRLVALDPADKMLYCYASSGEWVAEKY